MIINARRIAILAAALGSIAAPSSAAAVTVSPLNGTPDASPQSQISFLGTAPTAIASVVVKGSRSGVHSGRLSGYSSADGASFLPTQPFTQGEQVQVNATVGGRPVSTSFTVARLAHYPFNAPSAAPPATPATVQSYVSRGDLQPPRLDVTVSAPSATPGFVFLAPNSGPGQYGPMIVDGHGQVVWFTPVPRGSVGMDFQVQSFQGKPALVWWQGYIANLGIGYGADEIFDSSYRQVGRVAGGNGYQADLHDIQLTPQGSALITAYGLVRADLSSVHGPRNGILLDSILQDVDVATGLVKFEWHAQGHIPYSASYWPVPRASNQVWDFFHINSISPGPDGNLLVSSRNTWAGYDVSRANGAVLWTLGGNHSSFSMGPGTGTAWQHDMRWQSDGSISAFDNGAMPRAHSQSRVIRERVDLVHRSVRLVTRLVHSPALLAASQGNDQVLGGGGSFVSWGPAHYLTEYDAGGHVVFDAHLPANGQSYRAYRFPWTATPATPPSLVVHQASGSSDTVYASWNGATGVSAWRVLGGTAAASLAQVAQRARSGFETAITVPARQAFQVQALDAGGQVIGTSPAVGVSR